MSKCKLGHLCHPSCPECFPRLENHPWTPPVQASLRRADSITSVELAVVLCTREGTVIRPLRAIRCHYKDELSHIRQILLSDEESSLPPSFVFLRTVGKHTVEIPLSQESGKRAFRAKHFIPPHAPNRALCIADATETKTAVNRAPSQSLELCIRHLRGASLSESTLLGLIRVHPDAYLTELRREIQSQLPEAPTEYRFVRLVQGTIALVSSTQEFPSCKRPLKARHFAPPHSRTAELVIQTAKAYFEGEQLQDETKCRELKSLAHALHHPQASRPKGMDPYHVIKEKIKAYVNSFVNGEGGVIIFGANDDGIVERVPISGHKDKDCKSLKERVKLARTVKDDIRKLVDAVARQMDPPVDQDLILTQFVPVKTANGEKEDIETEDMFNVIEVHVKQGKYAVYFVDKHSCVAYERRDGCTCPMDPKTIANALGHTAKPGRSHPMDPGWGEWRKLEPVFDFNALMRRLSDPFAGREWLFVKLREMLNSQMTLHGNRGVALSGLRGTGKTCFMSELALRPKNVTGVEVVAHHLCRANDSDTLNPALFVRSIAAQLAKKSKPYRTVLIEDGVAILRALRLSHCEVDAYGAFLRGILQPLQEIEGSRKDKKAGSHKGSRSGFPLVILVDAIDESTTVDSKSGERVLTPGSESIAHLLERVINQNRSFPPWIKIVVSFRREMSQVVGPIQRLSRSLESVILDIEDEKHKLRAFNDIEQFVAAYMSSNRITYPFTGRVESWKPTKVPTLGNTAETEAYHMPVNTVLQQAVDMPIHGMECSDGDEQDPSELDKEMVKTLIIQSGGNYLYAKMVLDDIQGGMLEWEEIRSLPSGLDHLYTNFFQRHFRNDTGHGNNDIAVGSNRPSLRVVRPVMEVLLASPKRGLTEREIAHAMVAARACDPSWVSFCLQDIQWALTKEVTSAGTRYKISHESVRSWLEHREKDSTIHCRKESGHRMLAASLIQRCWPQQGKLSRWLDLGTVSPHAPQNAEWCDWSGFAPSAHDVHCLATHLVLSRTGTHDDRVVLLKSVGVELLNKVEGGRDSRHATALHSAALGGSYETTRLLLDAGVNPNMGIEGRTPLYLAAGKGYSDVVRALLDAGADVYTKRPSGRTALISASEHGSASTVKQILEALHILCKNDSRKNKQAFVNASQKDTGRTALSVAAEEGHDSVVELLLEAGASPALADRWGRTPVYHAALSGQLGFDAVKRLASAPSGDKTLNWGERSHMRSPLHEAVWNGHVHVVRALLECNANPNLVENDGGGPLHEAAYFGSSAQKQNQESLSEEDLSSRLEILKLMVESPRCCVNLAEMHGYTPIWYAAGGGSTEAVRMLLDAGSCIDPGEVEPAPSKERGGPSSPLLLALNRRNFEAALLLISRGAAIPPESEMDDPSRYPIEVTNALHHADQQDQSSRNSKMSHKGRVVIDYMKATKCHKIPKEFFARWPPYGQNKE